MARARVKRILRSRTKSERQQVSNLNSFPVCNPSGDLTVKFTMFTTARQVIRARKPISTARALSTRASNILSALGINPAGEVHGVYDGQWRGSGEILVSTCPTTGEELARVRTASKEELREALERTREAYTIFRSELESLFLLLSSLSPRRCSGT